VALQDLVLLNGEVVVVHVDLVELDLLVGGAGGHVAVVGRDLHLEDVVVVDLGRFVLAGHVLHVAVYVPLVVSERHPLQTAAHRYRPDAVIRLDCVLVLVVFVQVPLRHHSALVPEHYRALVGVQGCAVDGFIVLVLLDHVLGPEVKDAQPSVLAGSVDSFVALAEAADGSDVALEVGVE